MVKAADRRSSSRTENGMQRLRTWRELLGHVIKDPYEKQRLSQELQINPVTLGRWVNGQARPRQQRLRQLVSALPQLHEELLAAIQEEFEDKFSLSSEQEDDLLEEIPAAFYARALSAHANTTSALHAASVFALILQQALAHLDPDRRGMSIVVIRCVRPAPPGKVRSLRVGVGRGTQPWDSHLDNQPLLLGAESMVGHAVSSFQMIVNQDIKTGISYFPVRRAQWEASAVACPLLYMNRVAGCLLVASTQRNYFKSVHQAIIRDYANLLVLGFEADEFYERSNIDLGFMPAPEQQRPYFVNFQQRVANVMVEATQAGRALLRLQAEELVLWQLEAELRDRNQKPS